jgi:DnaK suppressor protein
VDIFLMKYCVKAAYLQSKKHAVSMSVGEILVGGIMRKVSTAKIVSTSSSQKASLSKKQLEDLRKKLLALREGIRESIEFKMRLAVDRSNECESLIKGDDAEVAEKQRSNNAILQEIDMMKSRLLLVERALYKIKVGSYGYCEETEEMIGFDRLWAVPWARYCVNVQELREKRLREFRSPRARAE